MVKTYSRIILPQTSLTYRQSLPMLSKFTWVHFRLKSKWANLELKGMFRWASLQGVLSAVCYYWLLQSHCFGRCFIYLFSTLSIQCTSCHFLLKTNVFTFSLDSSRGSINRWWRMTRMQQNIRNCRKTVRRPKRSAETHFEIYSFLWHKCPEQG